MTILSIENIKKHYGHVKALNGLDMQLNEGEVYGFLGRNGAGKSTTLQIIMGITFANTGKIELFDEEVKGDQPALRQHVGYVAQEQHFYQWMSPERIGKFVSGFYPSWDAAEYSRLLKLLEVPVDRKILGFSGGMRAKLALALALGHRPRLLLLDEPTAGMDAVARREFIDIIHDQAVRANRTTLFSSHLIDEVEQAADKVGIIHDGRMLYEGSLEGLRNSVKRVVCDDSIEQPIPLQWLEQGKILSDELRDGRREITIQYQQTSIFDADEISLDISPFTIEQPSLEDIFVAMVTTRVAL